MASSVGIIVGSQRMPVRRENFVGQPLEGGGQSQLIEDRRAELRGGAAHTLDQVVHMDAVSAMAMAERRRFTRGRFLRSREL